MMRRSRSRDGVALPSNSSAEGDSAAASGNGSGGNEGGKILSLRLGDLVCVTQETKGETHERDGETGARMRQATGHGLTMGHQK